jgi:hypothetical protein
MARKENGRREGMLSIHPLAEIFPPMPEEAFAALVADIRENGLREAIILHEGKVLDGRNRYLACLELGIEPITKLWDQRGDPLSYVVSKNLHRRHLSESQRAMVTAKIANMKHGGDRGNQHTGGKAPIGALAGEAVVSLKEAAEMMNVGERSANRARIVRAHGVPELQHAVTTGAVSVTAAAEIAQQPEEEQREIVERGETAIVDAAKTIRAQRPKQSRRRRRGWAGRSPQRLRADVWINLRDGLEHITSLPLPSEVVAIARAHDRTDLVDARLDRTIKWLDEFAQEWRCRCETAAPTAPLPAALPPSL